jgi:hypothetical protein
LARLVHAVIGYAGVLANQQAADKHHSDILAMREKLAMLRRSGKPNGVLEDKVDGLLRETEAAADSASERAEDARRELLEIGMLLDGRPLSDIDGHFRQLDLERAAIRRTIDHAINAL